MPLVQKVFFLIFQVVAGKKYQVKFTVWKTNCSKSEFEKLNEDCTATSDSVSNDNLANCNVSNAQIHLHQKL